MNPSPSRWSILFNNKPMTPGDEVLIFPGQANTLAVHSDDGAPATAARLVRTLPDGQSENCL